MALIQWTYPNFSIRAKTSAGAIALTWQPVTSPQSSSTFPVRLGPPELEPHELPRDLLNYERRPYVLGWWCRLPVVWIVRNYYIAGNTGIGLGTLHEVVSQSKLGGYLEVTLNGTAWKRCNVTRWQQTNLDGINVGIRLEAEFEQAALKSNPDNFSPNDW